MSEQNPQNDPQASVDDILTSHRAEKAGEQRVAADHGVAPSDQASGDDRPSDRGEQKTVPLGTYVEQRRRAKEDRERASAAEERASELENQLRIRRAEDELRERQRAAEQERLDQQYRAGEDIFSSSDPEKWVREKARAEFQNDLLEAGKDTFAIKHGPETLAAVEDAVQQAIDAHDPEVLQLQQAIRQAPYKAPDIALQWAQQTGRLGRVQRRAAAPPAYPSNLASTRSVGARNGPSWGGPSSLQDIFKR